MPDLGCKTRGGCSAAECRKGAQLALFFFCRGARVATRRVGSGLFRREGSGGLRWVLCSDRNATRLEDAVRDVVNPVAEVPDGDERDLEGEAGVAREDREEARLVEDVEGRARVRRAGDGRVAPGAREEGELA